MFIAALAACAFLFVSCSSNVDKIIDMKKDLAEAIADLDLEKVAELENLEVTDEELEAEFTKFSEQYGMEVDKIKEVVPADGLKADMLKEKAITFVKDNAKVTTARKPRAKKEEAAADAE